MIAVLDTNVLISATIQAQGLPAQIHRLWEAQFIQIAVSEVILQEYRRVLSYSRVAKRHRQDEAALDGLVKRLREKAVVVSGTVNIGRVSRDPDDDKFLAVALEAGADMIVSGDPDLLDLHSFREIPIVTPRAFIEQVMALWAEKAA